MTVFYRITSIPSSNPSPIFQDDKIKLNKICLKSFVNAFSDIRPTIRFICDNCEDPEMTDYLIQSTVPWKFSTEYTKVGQNETMLMSYEMAKNENDFVLFNECDHLWLPKSGNIMLSAMEELGLVSGYDHPDFYSRYDIHPKEVEIKLVGGHHFRKTARTVMSWGCHGNLVLKEYETLIKHGYLDDEVWRELREHGHQLWTAIPALETHMVRDYMAPGVDWSETWKYL